MAGGRVKGTFAPPVFGLRLRFRKRSLGPCKRHRPGRREERMLRRMMLATAAVAMMAGMAHADAIVGNWRTDSGETAQIAAAGNGFSITLRTGKHKGKRIGQMSAAGAGKYKGTITDPAD